MATPVYNEETFNYEILLRFGDVDPYKGLLRGAHRQTITQTTKNGVPIATNINAPEQLALIAVEEGELLSTVLGEINAETIILNGQLQQRLSDIGIINAELTEHIIGLRAELDSTGKELELANKRIDELLRQQINSASEVAIPGV